MFGFRPVYVRQVISQLSLSIPYSVYSGFAFHMNLKPHVQFLSKIALGIWCCMNGKTNGTKTSSMYRCALTACRSIRRGVRRLEAISARLTSNAFPPVSYWNWPWPSDSLSIGRVSWTTKRWALCLVGKGPLSVGKVLKSGDVAQMNGAAESRKHFFLVDIKNRDWKLELSSLLWL